MRSKPLTAAVAGLAVLLALAGCGTPGAPMPPSLKLPDPVTDLVAKRTGDQVLLTWVMPRKSTDKLLLKGSIPVRVCRKEGAGTCETVPGELWLAANARGSLNETLPASLASGPPRALTYFVELRNSKGRSAGLSNAATVLAGAAPARLTGLSATVRKQGVVLKWAAEPAPVAEPSTTVVRLERTLLTAESGARSAAQSNETTPGASKARSDQGFLATSKEPTQQSLLVEVPVQAGPAQPATLDKSIRFGNTYEYRAQRVARVSVGGQILELAGPLSDAVRIEARDVFPPDIPTGLAAVATAADSGANPPTGPSIDLSWQPVSDPDVAGYVVYRREGTSAWERISVGEPVIGPGFHDAHVEAGHVYQYAVSAIDRGGRESGRSQPAEESVPNP